MNKRIYKKQQRRLIGRALSLIYGQTRRKDLAFVYRVRPAYFRYFDKQRLRQVWKQIRKDSFNEKYRPDTQTFIVTESENAKSLARYMDGSRIFNLFKR